MTIDEMRNRAAGYTGLGEEMKEKTNQQWIGTRATVYAIAMALNAMSGAVWHVTAEICTRLDTLIEFGEKR